MNLKSLLPQLQTNAETLLLSTALHYAVAGKIDTKHIDADALAIALFTLAAQLEKEHPGIAEKYGWAELSDLQAFNQAITDAGKATPPSGLH